MLFFVSGGVFQLFVKHCFGQFGFHLFAGFQGNFLANLSLSLVRAFGRFFRKFPEKYPSTLFCRIFSSEWGIFCGKKGPPDAKRKFGPVKRKLGPLSGNLGPLSGNLGQLSGNLGPLSGNLGPLSGNLGRGTGTQKNSTQNKNSQKKLAEGEIWARGAQKRGGGPQNKPHCPKTTKKKIHTQFFKFGVCGMLNLRNGFHAASVSF